MPLQQGSGKPSKSMTALKNSYLSLFKREYIWFQTIWGSTSLRKAFLFPIQLLCLSCQGLTGDDVEVANPQWWITPSLCWTTFCLEQTWKNNQHQPTQWAHMVVSCWFWPRAVRAVRALLTISSTTIGGSGARRWISGARTDPWRVPWWSDRPRRRRLF